MGPFQPQVKRNCLEGHICTESHRNRIFLDYGKSWCMNTLCGQIKWRILLWNALSLCWWYPKHQSSTAMNHEPNTRIFEIFSTRVLQARRKVKYSTNHICCLLTSSNPSEPNTNTGSFLYFTLERAWVVGPIWALSQPLRCSLRHAWPGAQAKQLIIKFWALFWAYFQLFYHHCSR